MELEQAGDDNIGTVARLWAKRDQVLKPLWIAADRDSFGARERFETADRLAGHAEDRYRYQHHTNPPSGPDHRSVGLWLLIFVLHVVEFPMNAMVFRQFGSRP